MPNPSIAIPSLRYAVILKTLMRRLHNLVITAMGSKDIHTIIHSINFEIVIDAEQENPENVQITWQNLVFTVGCPG